MSLRLGIDTGGTYTDAVIINEHNQVLVAVKSLTTRHNLAIGIGESITIESIIGSTFSVKVDEITTFGKYQAVIPEVRGTAFLTGKNTFWINPNDPLKDGFILR